MKAFRRNKNRNKNKNKKEFNFFEDIKTDFSIPVDDPTKFDFNALNDNVVNVEEEKEVEVEVEEKEVQSIEDLIFKREEVNIVEDSEVLLKEVVQATITKKNKEVPVVTKEEEEDDSIYINFVPNKEYRIICKNNNNVKIWQSFDFCDEEDSQLHVKFTRDTNKTTKVIITEIDNRKQLKNLNSCNIKSCNKLDFKIRFQNDRIIMVINNKIKMNLKRRLTKLPEKIRIGDKKLISVN